MPGRYFLFKVILMIDLDTYYIDSDIHSQLRNLLAIINSFSIK